MTEMTPADKKTLAVLDKQIAALDARVQKAGKLLDANKPTDTTVKTINKKVHTLIHYLEYNHDSRTTRVQDELKTLTAPSANRSQWVEEYLSLLNSLVMLLRVRESIISRYSVGGRWSRVGEGDDPTGGGFSQSDLEEVIRRGAEKRSAVSDE